jgi:hypothetical protein
MSGQSRTLAEILAGERFLSDDRPKIGEYDELLEALRREFGPDGRPDIAIPRPRADPARG